MLLSIMSSSDLTEEPTEQDSVATKGHWEFDIVGIHLHSGRDFVVLNGVMIVTFHKLQTKPRWLKCV